MNHTLLKKLSLFVLLIFALSCAKKDLSLHVHHDESNEQNTKSFENDINLKLSTTAKAVILTEQMVNTPLDDEELPFRVLTPLLYFQTEDFSSLSQKGSAPILAHYCVFYRFPSSKVYKQKSFLQADSMDLSKNLGELYLTPLLPPKNSLLNNEEEIKKLCTFEAFKENSPISILYPVYSLNIYLTGAEGGIFKKSELNPFHFYLIGEFFSEQQKALIPFKIAVPLTNLKREISKGALLGPFDYEDEESLVKGVSFSKLAHP